MSKLGAYTIFLFSQGAAALLFSSVFTANMIYQVMTVQLNPLQLVLVGTTLETTVFIFEVPTGIVADAYSRRLSIVIGFFLIGLGFIVEGMIARFEAVLLGQLLWGIGYTFTSGATQAWISDEIGEARAGHAFLRAAQIGQIGGLAGIALSVIIGSIAINLPIVLGGGLFLALAAFLALFMPERGFKPTPKENRNSWQHMAEIFKQGIAMVQRRPALVTILGSSAIYGMFSEGFDRLWTAHMLQDMTLPAFGNFQPIVWIGMVRAVAKPLSAVVLEIVRQKVDTTSQVSIVHTMMMASAILSAAVITFGWTNEFFLAVLAFWIIAALRAVEGPLHNAWINQRLDPQTRATVISMSSQANALGQIAGGPGVGAIGNTFSIRAAIVTSGTLLSPVLGLYVRVARRTDEQGAIP